MLKTALQRPHEFIITYELVPGQSSSGRRVERMLDFARHVKADGRVSALSVTDNPGGSPALAPAAIGEELLNIGIDPLIHFSLKDKNRDQVVSHIYLYQRLGLHSLLVLGGDFPRPGYYGQARPVFDLDSIQTLRLLRDMEQGRFLGGDAEVQPLFKGCVVSPFKATEAEQVWQYVQLRHKVEAGADFIISQLGFDLHKFNELITFVRRSGITLPVLANVFIPSLPVARAMAAGKVPGVLLAEELLTQIEHEAAAGQSQVRLERAAMMIARLKRSGFQGVHLGGNSLSFADLSTVLDKCIQFDQEAELPAANWNFPFKKTWYFYRQKASILEETQLRPGLKPGSVKIRALSHRLMFDQQQLTGRLFAHFCLYCAQGKRRTAALTLIERAVKRVLFNCRMCGDCTLARATFLCPQAGCPKRLVNGPCGGSRSGFCEVFPERRCFWVRVYERLAPQTTLALLVAQPPLPPKDWALEKTSFWINLFTGRVRKTK